MWNILGHTYYEKSNSATSSRSSLHPPGTFVPPHIHPSATNSSTCSKARSTFTWTENGFARSVVRNHARLTYRLVDDLLVKKDRQLRTRYRPFLKMLGQMTAVCDLLRERRGERGSLLMSIPEAEVVLDDRGWPVDIRRLDHLVSHQLIEEFMIAANEAVSTFLGEPSLFRVHERPDAAKLAAFRTYLKTLGFDLPKEVHRDPRVLRDFLDEVQKTLWPPWCS